MAAGSGNNRISVGGGNNTVIAGSGNDTIYAGGTLGNTNLIRAGGGNDSIVLGDANDTVYLEAGSSTLSAGNGSDTVYLAFGANLGKKNVLSGGAGNDTLVLSFTAAERALPAVEADLVRFKAHVAAGLAASSFQFTSIDLKVDNWEKLVVLVNGLLENGTPYVPPVEQEIVTRGAASDVINTGNANDIIDAGAGNNLVNAGYGNNTVTAGDHNDTITAYSGDDVIHAGGGDFNYVYAGYGNNLVTAKDGNDYIYAYAGDDTIEAGSGKNYVDVGYGNNKVTTGDNNDTVIAYSGDDTIQAGGGNNYIHAGAGKNEISAGSGNDTVYAFEGNDRIDAGGGNNYIEAGHGNNGITTLDGHDTIVAGVGNDTILAGAGNNYIITGEGNDTVRTGAGNDSIFGGCVGDSDIEAGDGQNYVSLGGGNNLLVTGSGNDTIIGGGNLGNHNLITAGGGNDYLCLGAADDTVMLGSGNSTLVAGDGDDRAVLVYGENLATRNELWGGCGSDTLVLRFSHAELARADVKADIARYEKHLAEGKADVLFKFNTIDLTVHSWEKFEAQEINEAPVLPAALAFAGKEDEPLTFNLLSSATDVNGDALTLVGVQGFAHGTPTVAADGTVTYTGASNWSGTETVTYTVSDGKGELSTGTAIITIAGVADAPELSVVRNDIFTFDLRSALTDTDGSETLSLTVAGLPSEVRLSKGSFDAGAGLWVIDPADAGTIRFQTDPGLEVPRDLDMVVTATSREADGDLISTTYRLFGMDDDRVALGQLPGAHEIVDGGAGFDTLVFNAMPDLDLTALATNSLRNLEKIDMAGDARTLTLSADKVSEMTSADKLYVTGDAGDQVNLVAGGWNLQSTVTENNISYNVYQHNAASLYLENTLTAVI